jgi:hypothetical protein
MNQIPRLLVGENQIRKTSHTKTRKARNKKEEEKRRERNRTNTTTAAAKDLQPAAKTLAT